MNRYLTVRRYRVECPTTAVDRTPGTIWLGTFLDEDAAHDQADAAKAHYPEAPIRVRIVEPVG